MRKAIIFGSGGQDGYYMEQLLQKLCIKVTALTHDECDVSYEDHVESIIAIQKPEYVFHFAARSSTDHKATMDNQKAIVDGTLKILEACRVHSPETKIFISGSILQFGDEGMWIRETDPFVDNSPYAAQRNASVHMARYYRDKLGMKVFIGYFAHHDSPRRSNHHLAKKIADAAVRIAEGSTELIELNNAYFHKEWNFAGETMKAVWLLVNSDQSEAMIGSGQIASVEDYAVACLNAVGVRYPVNHIRHAQPSEYKAICASADTMIRLGWKPKTSLHGLAVAMTSRDIS